MSAEIISMARELGMTPGEMREIVDRTLESLQFSAEEAAGLRHAVFSDHSTGIPQVAGYVNGLDVVECSDVEDDYEGPVEEFEFVMELSVMRDLKVGGKEGSGEQLPGPVGYCDRCGFEEVKLLGHEGRCRMPQVKDIGGARDSLVGDAVHALDVRSIVAAVSCDIAELTHDVERYVSGKAQRAYMETKFSSELFPGHRSDRTWSTAFEVRYKGDFRREYLAWMFADYGKYKAIDPKARALTVQDGEWNLPLLTARVDGVITHVLGIAVMPKVVPEMQVGAPEGECYLLLFRPDVRQLVREKLGLWPTLALVLSWPEAYYDMESFGVLNCDVFGGQWLHVGLDIKGLTVWKMLEHYYRENPGRRELGGLGYVPLPYVAKTTTASGCIGRTYCNTHIPLLLEAMRGKSAFGDIAMVMQGDDQMVDVRRVQCSCGRQSCIRVSERCDSDMLDVAWWTASETFETPTVLVREDPEGRDPLCRYVLDVGAYSLQLHQCGIYNGLAVRASVIMVLLPAKTVVQLPGGQLLRVGLEPTRLMAMNQVSIRLVEGNVKSVMAFIGHSTDAVEWYKRYAKMDPVDAETLCLRQVGSTVAVVSFGGDIGGNGGLYAKLEPEEGWFSKEDRFGSKELSVKRLETSGIVKAEGVDDVVAVTKGTVELRGCVAVVGIEIVVGGGQHVTIVGTSVSVFFAEKVGDSRVLVFSGNVGSSVGEGNGESFSENDSITDDSLE